MTHRAQMAVRAVAFDLDGLMFNTEDLYVRVADDMLTRRNLTLDMRLIHNMMGRPARVALPLMIDWYKLDESVEQLERETQDIFFRILPASLRPMPGLLDLLQELEQRGCAKAIATSSRRDYVDRVLEIAQLPAQFDFMLTADDVLHGKPDPEIYRTAAERFGVVPREMVVLEDSVNGCRAALAAEAITVAVPTEQSQHQEYPPVQLRASSLSDVRLWQLMFASPSDHRAV